MDLVNFLALAIDKDMLIIYALIILMAILLIVIFTLDAKSKKKKVEEEVVIEGTTPLEKYQQDNNIESKIDEKIEQLEEQKPKVEEAIEEKIEEPKIEETSNIKYEDDKTEEEKEQLAKEELNQVALSLIDDKSDNEGLTNFEIEQEENAIISYNELVKVSEDLYNENEKTQYSDEGNEPINIEQLRMKFDSTEPQGEETLEKNDLTEAINLVIKDEQKEIKTEERPKVKLNDFIDKPAEETKKFKTSPIISPVFGIEREEEIKKDTELELEQTADLEKLDAEIRKTNQFLQILKELQKKLD